MASLARLLFGVRPKEPTDVRIKRLAARHREILSWASLGTVCLFFSQLDKAFPNSSAVQIIRLLKDPAKLLVFYGKYLQESDVLDASLLIANFHVILLGAVTIYWYNQYSGAVAKEAGILCDLYAHTSEQRVEWDHITGSRFLPLMSLLFLALFVAACATITRLHIFCGVVLLLNLFDFVGNYLVQKNIKAFSNDKRFMPSPRNPEFPAIIRKRRIAREYWLKNEQLMRILAFTLGNLLVFYLANLKAAAQPDSWAASIPDPPLYLFMCALILGNERLMGIWRAARDKQFQDVQDAERRAKLAAYREEPTSTAVALPP